jgi:hypothetical protein
MVRLSKLSVEVKVAASRLLRQVLLLTETLSMRANVRVVKNSQKVNRFFTISLPAGRGWLDLSGLSRTESD